MAKAKTAVAPKPKKKAKAGKPVTLKAKPDGGKKAKKSRARDGFDALAKLAEHPLVGELLAVGAMAAVAAIAEQGLARKGKKGKAVSSKTAVKAAATAAAAAIGQQLVEEFTHSKMAAKPKSAKA